MPRAKGGSKTRQRRKKVLNRAKGYFGGRRKLYRTAAERIVGGDPRVQDILDRALADIAGARSTSALEQVRVRVLGRSGELTALLRGLGKVPAADRPRFGQEVNRAKERLEAELEVRLVALKAEEHRQALQAQRPDLTLTGRAILPGAVHPLVRVLDEIIEIFAGLGFSVAEGPEVETDYYN